MSILDLLRVTMHPWLWLAIVRNAIARNTKTQSLSLVSRRKAADVLKLFDKKWDADYNVASPYQRLTKKQLHTFETRNAEILAKDPVYGIYEEDKVVDGKVVIGYRYIPKPDLRESVDLTEPLRDYCVEAVEALAKEPDLDNTNSQGILDAIDALRAGATVTIDTEKVP